ncbi:bacteriocin biosynthesis docking scaffold, SagD family [Actinomyces howellii]|uniref:Bacteriocin biosynthesis docking scaffold, SagD family n=2 Tax=Actinomyces howellii TaxID=52771 RepID=A0A3S4UX16_9ACTO|nr:bacteriocin biosynthesis docking scaffold, SagD family [Actinomyces howellii]
MMHVDDAIENYKWSEWRDALSTRLANDLEGIQLDLSLSWRCEIVSEWSNVSEGSHPDTELYFLVRAIPGELQIMAWRPGHPGCPACIASRQTLADPNADRWRDLESRWMTEDTTTLLSSTHAELACSVTIGLIRIICADLGRYCNGVVLRVATDDFAVSQNSFLPDPLCPNCSPVPDDTKEAAVPDFSGLEKTTPTTYRHDTPKLLLKRIKRAYVDSHCGIIHAMERDRQGGMVIALAKMKLRRHNWVEPGFGRSDSYEVSEATAILEAIERYGGVQPGGKRTVVVGSLEELASVAIDPRHFGVHPDETYESEENYFHKFDPSARYRWVWGYSLTQDRAVLVPESIAYYYISHDEYPGPFVYEVSNGCAVGTSLEESIFHALLEVIERDAFLMTWYRHLELPRIRIDKDSSGELWTRIRQVELESGYRIEMYDQTMDNRVPSVLVRAVGEGGGSMPAQVFGAAAHPVQAHAAMSALAELGPFVRHLKETYVSFQDRSEAMVDDPSLVASMEDHSKLFASPRTLPWVDFLGRGDVVELAAETEDNVPIDLKGSTLVDDLRALVARFSALQQDVVYVDQTTPEHRAGGLRCVKVLVTDSLTMTFGAAFRRIDGLTRIDRVPDALGLVAGAKAGEELRPHPFP